MIVLPASERLGSLKISTRSSGESREVSSDECGKESRNRVPVCVMNGILTSFLGKQHPQWSEGVAFTKWLKIRRSTGWEMTLRADYFWGRSVTGGHIIEGQLPWA